MKLNRNESKKMCALALAATLSTSLVGCTDIEYHVYGNTSKDEIVDEIILRISEEDAEAILATDEKSLTVVSDIGVLNLPVSELQNEIINEKKTKKSLMCVAGGLIVYQIGIIVSWMFRLKRLSSPQEMDTEEAKTKVIEK